MNIPENVMNDKFVKIYTQRDIDNNIIFQATRKPSPNDIPAVKVGSIIRVPAKYFGEWEDTTEEAQRIYNAKKPKTKKKEASSEFQNTVINDSLSELEKAEQLLKALRGE